MREAFPVSRLIDEAEKTGKANGMALMDGKAFQLVVVRCSPRPIAWRRLIPGGRRVARDFQNLTAATSRYSAAGRKANGGCSHLDAGTRVAESLRQALTNRRVRTQSISLTVSGHEYETC